MATLTTEPIDYRTEETSWGVWRRCSYATGRRFAEFTSHRRVFGAPLLHYTYGKCPETGRRIVAKGIFAIGRMAVGLVAFGQLAVGFIAVGQLAISPLLGMGQACTGVCAIGQLALGVAFGLGQLTTGYAAIGQIALGEYVLAQIGLGRHVVDMRRADPAVWQFFRSLLP